MPVGRRVVLVAAVIRFELETSGWASTFIPVAGESFTDSAAGTCH